MWKETDFLGWVWSGDSGSTSGFANSNVTLTASLSLLCNLLLLATEALGNLSTITKPHLAYRYFCWPALFVYFSNPSQCSKVGRFCLKIRFLASIQQLEDLIPVSHSNRQNKSEYNGTSSSNVMCFPLSPVFTTPYSHHKAGTKC